MALSAIFWQSNLLFFFVFSFFLFFFSFCWTIFARQQFRAKRISRCLMMMNAVSGADDERSTEYETIFLLLPSNNSSNNTISTAGGEEDYDYDIDSSFDNYDWAELIPAVVVYSFVLLFGISGNGKYLYSIYQHHFRLIWLYYSYYYDDFKNFIFELNCWRVFFLQVPLLFNIPRHYLSEKVIFICRPHALLQPTLLILKLANQSKDNNNMCALCAIQSWCGQGEIIIKHIHLPCMYEMYMGDLRYFITWYWLVRV